MKIRQKLSKPGRMSPLRPSKVSDYSDTQREFTFAVNTTELEKPFSQYTEVLNDPSSSMYPFESPMLNN